MESVPDSVIGRLLQEVSWEGNPRHYRDGGIGRENVLTAEVFQAPDFLPRTAFLGEVLAAASGADRARRMVIEDVESCALTFLAEYRPAGKTGLPPSGALGPIDVQPDAELDSPRSFTVIEAKRLRTNAFQRNQLAKLCVHALARAGGRTCLVALVGTGPELLVKGEGRLSIVDAVDLEAERVIQTAPELGLSRATLLSTVPDLVCTLSWPELETAVRAATERNYGGDSSLDRSIQRLAASITASLERHR